MKILFLLLLSFPILAQNSGYSIGLNKTDTSTVYNYPLTSGNFWEFISIDTVTIFNPLNNFRSSVTREVLGDTFPRKWFCL